MNRLILIGNGFDIAHGLETRYSDFLKFYWNSVKHSYHKDEGLLEFHNSYPTNEAIELSKDSFKEVIERLNFKEHKDFNNYRYVNSEWHLRLDFKNYLFHYLNINNRGKHNWVDFEEDYYTILKMVKDKKVSPTYTIESLNNDLKKIAKKFEEYLKTQVTPKINDAKTSEIAELFMPKWLIDEVGTSNFLREFPLKRQEEIQENFVLNKKNKIITHYAFNETLVLNFNYTNTPNLYVNKSEIINIHGSLIDNSNPILLGFGDEKDKFYSEIEDLNDNDYLEFMKSTYYSKTSNYKRLFDYLDSDAFQVQIMGHSCGLSDRTLLNSIFQHENCRSIKVYYHEFEKPDSNGDLDNFTQITRNISRHFTDKVMMRERIVNKEYCKPLPQKLGD